MVGDSCLARPLRCSVPGDNVRGLMGAVRRRGELLDMRKDELMEGLLSDDCSWQLLRDAWIEGLLREDERPAGAGEAGAHPSDKESIVLCLNVGTSLSTLMHGVNPDCYCRLKLHTAAVSLSIIAS